jgi:hypothetical protein
MTNFKKKGRLLRAPVWPLVSMHKHRSGLTRFPLGNAAGARLLVF